LRKKKRINEKQKIQLQKNFVEQDAKKRRNQFLNLNLNFLIHIIDSMRSVIHCE